MIQAFIIEFAPVDRPQRNVFIPYVVGLARTRGVDVVWLRFGLAAAHRHRSLEAGVDLPPSSRSALLRRLREAPAAPIVFSHVPSPALHRAASEGTGRRIAVASERPAPVGGSIGLENIADDAGTWLELLGLPVGDVPEGRASIFRVATPDFTFTPGNREAEEMAPLPCLVLADPCSYRRTVTSNPRFDGVDLSGCLDAVGCSFCAIPSAEVRIGGFSRDRAARQLAALHGTLPGNVRLIGDAALLHAADIVELILATDLPGAGWEFDARADTILRSGDVLREALTRCAGSGHRLHLSLIGVENFSRPELERFNKGLTPLQNLEAVELLLRLEMEFPKHFRFREHGGISMILFTPWTTLEDLQINLATVRNGRLEGLSGKLLASRLRLLDALPVTALARRDGLLTEGYGDRAFDTAGLNLYDAELPWRFADPAVEDACSVLIRFPPRGDLPGDALTPRVQRFVERVGRHGVGRLDAALAVVDVLLESRGAASELRTRGGPEGRIEWLVAAVESRILGEVGASHAAPLEPALTFLRPTSHGPWTERNLRHLADLVAAGIKPVAKLEDAPRENLARYIDEFALPNPRTQEVPGSGGAHHHLFFGRSLADVERMVASSHRAVAEEAEVEGEDRQALGRLLGYPACCVEAYARDFPVHGKDALLHLRRSLDRPGVVFPELAPVNPYSNFVHVPCALDCEASRALTLRAVEVLHPDEGERSAYLASLRNPWLIMLDLDGQVVELVPDSAPGGRFAFHAGQVGLRSPLTDRIAEADEVVLEDERLLLLRRGAVHLDLSGRAFVWWHRGTLQAELWERLLGIREAVFRQQGGAPRSDLPSAAAHAPTARLRCRLSHLLARLGWLGLGKVGVEVRIEDTHGEDHLHLEVARGDLRVRLQVSAAASGGDAWFRCGGFSFSHPSDARSLGPEHREMIGLFVRLLILALDLGRGGPGTDVLVDVPSANLASDQSGCRSAGMRSAW
ncbi:MAG: DUF483 domain-containing protein [Pseudomonadota bacterium]